MAFDGTTVPPSAGKPDECLGFKPGDVIGPYELLGLLGEGGFGVVYEAVQHAPIRRHVALKIVKPGMDSANVLARFEAERQALAVMDHPAIASVLDGGLTEQQHGGRPFFVMELVKGVPIDDFCDRHRLTIDQRCSLFVAVCRAVQHAHAKGIVHRDLKPANVLVYYNAEGQAQPKIIDFGVAKALNQRLTEETIFTEQGQLIGTPEYMSPEQAEMSGLDIDTRSDIYSLGVLLYVLLAGVLPFDTKQLRKAGLDGIRKLIRESPPPKPSTRLSTVFASDQGSASKLVQSRSTDSRSLTSVLRRDLDWVVMKCLEKDREYRYPSADALGQDILRFLHSEPLVAGPPSVWRKLSKFVRRNRLPVGAATLSLLSLIAGTTWLAVLLDRVSSDRATILNQASELRDLLVRAEDAERVASDRADSLRSTVQFQEERLERIDVAQMALAFRDYLLASPVEELRSQRVEALTGVDFVEAARRSLDEGIFAPTLEAASNEFEEDPAIRARILQATAVGLRSVGSYERALEVQREVLETLAAIPEEASLQRAAAVHGLAIAQADTGDIAAAVENFDKARKMLHEYREMSPDLYLENLLWTTQFTRRGGDFEGALDLCTSGARESVALLGEDSDWRIRFDQEHATILGSLGRTIEAEEIALGTVERSSRVFGPTHPYTESAKLTLCGIYSYGIDNARKSIPILHEILQARERRLGRDHPDSVSLTGWLSTAYFWAQEHDEALRYAQEEYERATRIYSRDHPEVLYAIQSLLVLRSQTGRLDASDESLVRELYDRTLQQLPEHSPIAIQRTYLTAGGLQAFGHQDEADDLYERAAMLARQHLPYSHEYRAMSLHLLAHVRERQGDVGAAADFSLDSLRGRESGFAPTHPGSLWFREMTIRRLIRADRYEEALTEVQLFEEYANKSKTNTDWWLKASAELHVRILEALTQRSPDEQLRAELSNWRLVRRKRDADGEQGLPALPGDPLTLARSLRQEGQVADAIGVLESALQSGYRADAQELLMRMLMETWNNKLLFEKATEAADRSPERVWSWIYLGTAQERLGDQFAAAISAQRALDLDENLVDCHILLADIANNDGRHEDALRASNRAIDLHPGWSATWMRAARANLELGRWDEARAGGEKIVELNPGWDYGHYVLARAHRNLGNLEESLAAAERCVELGPGWNVAWHELAVSHKALGDISSAMDAWESGFEVDSADSWMAPRVLYLEAAIEADFCERARPVAEFVLARTDVNSAESRVAKRVIDCAQ